MTPRAEEQEQRWVSGAKLSGASLVTLLPRRIVETLCPEGLTLEVLPHVRRDQHPVCVELWDVDEGRLQFGGQSQDEAAASMGRTVGAVLGGALGVSVPFQSFRGGSAAKRIAETSATVAANAFSTASRLLASPFGRCREVLVGIPGVRYGNHGSFYFVREMFSDSAVAVAGARLGDYGFNKKFSRIRVEGDRWRVRDGSGRDLLSVELIMHEATPLPQPQEIPVTDWVTRTLLGKASGGYTSSVLERRFGGATLMCPVEAVVFGGVVFARETQARCFSSENLAGSIGYVRLPTRVSIGRSLPSAPGGASA